jgi:hypothetical protein
MKNAENSMISKVSWMMRIFKTALFGVAAMFAAQAFAVVGTTTLFTTIMATGDPTHSQSISTGISPANLENYYFTYDVGNAHVYSWGSVADGTLKSYVEGSAFVLPSYLRDLTGTPYIVAAASSDVSFHESLRIDSAGRNGQSGIATIRLYWNAGVLGYSVSGSDTMPSSVARYDAQFKVSIANVQAREELKLDYGSLAPVVSHCMGVNSVESCTSDYLRWTFDMQVPFIFGRSLPVFMDLSTMINGSSFISGQQHEYLNEYHMAVDASHSAYWGGVTSVTVNGLAITDYATDATALGQSYIPTSAVPEPLTSVMFVAGLLGILAIQRQREPKRK